MTGLVVGGADNWTADILAACRLFQPDVVIAINDVGTILPCVDHWATLHSDKFPRWEKARRELGATTDYTRWSCSEGHYVDRIVRNWFGGSSSLLAVDVALNGLDLDRVVLAGCPMDERPNAFRTERGWAHFNRFRAGWERAEREIAGRVRSMSGWTREKFGAPDADWLNRREAA